MPMMLGYIRELCILFKAGNFFCYHLYDVSGRVWTLKQQPIWIKDAWDRENMQHHNKFLHNCKLVASLVAGLPVLLHNSTDFISLFPNKNILKNTMYWKDTMFCFIVN